MTPAERIAGRREQVGQVAGIADDDHLQRRRPTAKVDPKRCAAARVPDRDQTSGPHDPHHGDGLRGPGMGSGPAWHVTVPEGRIRCIRHLTQIDRLVARRRQRSGRCRMRAPVEPVPFAMSDRGMPRAHDSRVRGRRAVDGVAPTDRRRRRQGNGSSPAGPRAAAHRALWRPRGQIVRRRVAADVRIAAAGRLVRPGRPASVGGLALRVRFGINTGEVLAAARIPSVAR